MNLTGRGIAVGLVVCCGGALAAGIATSAFATTVSDPTGSIAVAYDGGCAYGSLAAVAVGESGCGYEAQAPVALGVAGADSASTCPLMPPLWFCWPSLALSDTGDAHARSEFGIAVSGTGNAQGTRSFVIDAWSGYAVSGTGTASNGMVVFSPLGNAREGSFVVSGTGTAYNPGYNEYCQHSGETSASGTGDAYGSQTTVSGTGNAYGNTQDCFLGPRGHAVSGTGDAESGSAVAGRNARAHGGQAVALTGDASGGHYGVGGRNAQGGTVAVAATGAATAPGTRDTYGNSYQPIAAIGWSDASTYGGYLCVSATGNCSGGALVGVAPLGSSN